MQAHVAPKKKPVISLLSPSLGKTRTSGRPDPNMTMTSDRPTNTNGAVPISSEKNSRQEKK